MLNYKILDYKNTINNDNDTYIDLMGNILDKDMTFIPTPIIVNEYYVARPDLISLALYGDDKYADIICKINGISNPFELNENDIIIVPNIEYLSDCIKRNNDTDIIKDSKKETIQKIDKNNKQKKKNDTRSPNEQIVGESNFVIDKSLGVVFY